MLLSQFAGGYTKEFAECILSLFENTISQEDAMWTLPADEVQDLRRRALLDDVPITIHKARRQRLLDDVPSSSRRALGQHEPRSYLKLQHTAREEEEVPLKKKKMTQRQLESLQDVPLSLRRGRERPSPYGQRLRPVPENDEQEEIPQLPHTDYHLTSYHIPAHRRHGRPYLDSDGGNES